MGASFHTRFKPTKVWVSRHQWTLRRYLTPGWNVDAWFSFRKDFAKQYSSKLQHGSIIRYRIQTDRNFSDPQSVNFERRMECGCINSLCNQKERQLSWYDWYKFCSNEEVITLRLIWYQKPCYDCISIVLRNILMPVTILELLGLEIVLMRQNWTDALYQVFSLVLGVGLATSDNLIVRVA